MLALSLKNNVGFAIRRNKPPHLPLAKSKRYRVMHIPWQDPEEVKEMLWRRHAYNCAVKSIREYYRQCLAGLQTESMASASYQDEIAQEFKALLEENDVLNAKQADKREAKAAEKRRKIEEEVEAMVEKHVQETLAEMAKREKEVLEWIEKSKNFVTLDNMDEMIERALENPVDFNYALDTKGRMFKGKAPAKYNTENLLLAKPVSEETAARIPAGRLKDFNTMEKAEASPSEGKCENVEGIGEDIDAEVQKYTVNEDLLIKLELEMDEQTKLERMQEAMTTKEKGNEYFKSKDYLEAAKLYTEALKTCPPSFSQQRAVFYGNRAACFTNMNKMPMAIEDCNMALSLDPNYLRVLRRRASLYQQDEKTLEKAVEDLKSILTQCPTDTSVRNSLQEVERKIGQRDAKLKEDMMAQLKSLGNVILKPFGLSTDNFRVQQRSDGSFNIEMAK
ncbi:TPR 11 and MRP-S26 domain containing protein [Trichuris trichiura]|uniref:TPR 11 and MRP-S26 domain containing protein n=1 Tax=Trichuris trichiura TaxID=36087 RepID=A0A077ZEN8_TRITR|nr:TPR 11 and MRP-S26 domain containing protein [Trichuris trichiura]